MNPNLREKILKHFKTYENKALEAGYSKEDINKVIQATWGVILHHWGDPHLNGLTDVKILQMMHDKYLKSKEKKDDRTKQENSARLPQ